MEAVERLHYLSQHLHIVREDLTDLQERLEYLCGVHRRLLDLLGDRHEPGDVESVADSFNYVKAKPSTLKRWVINYTERTGIRINLFFNISTQSDNRMNLDIARPTSKIAVTTQRDSSLMITYAPNSHSSWLVWMVESKQWCNRFSKVDGRDHMMSEF